MTLARRTDEKKLLHNFILDVFELFQPSVKFWLTLIFRDTEVVSFVILVDVIIMSRWCLDSQLDNKYSETVIVKTQSRRPHYNHHVVI